MGKVAVVYWSGTGNTEAMANAIAKGLEEAGQTADVMEVASAKAADVAAYGKMALGCPSMGDEVLEESEFEPFFADLEKLLSGKKVALFGSYDWGDGQWMRDWVERTQAANANVFGEGFIQNLAPDEDECVAFGREYAAF